MRVQALNGETPSDWSDPSDAERTNSDTDTPTVYVSFEQSTYTVDEGSSVTVKVELSADPERSVMISISRTNQDGADEDDYFLPASVTFNSGETSQTISFNASVDTVDDGGESVTLGFANLPQGVSAGTPNVATVSITDVPAVDEDATLRSLSLSGITMLQAFSPHTYQYSASVPSFVSSTRVTAAPNAPGASVEIKVIAGGSLNADDTTVTLAEGGNIIRARVIAPDGTEQDYAVVVYRAAAPAPGSASDATLRSLILSGIALNAPFDSDTTSYTASVVNGVSSTTVYAPPSDNNATRVVKRNGVLDNDGTVALKLVTNTITVVVTAQDETTKETYTVTVTRDTGGVQPSSDATLGSLSLSGNTLTPTFASGTYAYAASVGNTVAEVTVTPTQNDSGATIEYLDASDMTLTDADTSDPGQQVALAVGDNVIKVKVTAANTTTTLTYSVTVNRLAAGNNAPVFSESMLTRSVAENTGANQNVGAVIPAAMDADGDSLTYTMEGADAASFTFEASARRIKTSAALDFEAKNSYAVTVRVSDGAASASVDVTIAVTDEDEPPAAPGAPTVSATAGSTMSLDVSWTAPGNTGKPAITSYDLRYRVGSSGSWTDGPQDETGTASAISGLAEGTGYQVQVRASNAEGDGAWSAAGTGSTGSTPTPGNNAPEFPSATATHEVPENSVAGTNVGGVIPAATDADGDSLTYTMEGADAASFAFNASTRQITTITGVDYNYEATKNSYAVTVRVSDGAASASVDVTIAVTDEDEPPAAPGAPTVSATAGSTMSLDVSWTAPGNTGKPAITSYDLRYRVGSSGSWTDGPQDETGTASAISGLAEGTGYQVQVRASNAEGDGAWSAAGTGSTNTETTLSSDATLSSLSLSGITLDPAFSSDQETYAARVANTVSSTTVMAATTDDGASVAIALNGAVSDGTVNLEVGGGNTITVEVTAEDGTRMQTYTVTVNRASAATLTTTLVSNLGQTDASTHAITIPALKRGQQFETGSNSDGYTLTEIVVNIRDARTGTPAFALYTSTADDKPGAKVVDLIGDSSTPGEQSFTPASTTTLNASTKYFIMFSMTSGQANLQKTASDNIDAGGSTGWDIAETSVYGANSTTSSKHSVEIAVKGTAVGGTPPPVSTDATLSRLAVNDGSSDLTLTPTFASGTYAYAASVGNTVAEVTVTPTQNDSGATIEYLDASDMTLTDADTSAIPASRWRWRWATTSSR